MLWTANHIGKYDDMAAKECPSIHGEGEEIVEVAKPNGTKETLCTYGRRRNQSLKETETQNIYFRENQKRQKSG